MIVSASIHDLGNDPITAKAEIYPDTAWLELKFGFQAAFNIFMPAARAQRLADAINAAERN